MYASVPGTSPTAVSVSACASRRAREPVLPARGTILTATSRPLRSSRASQTDPEPPLPRGWIGRYLPRKRACSRRAAAASDTFCILMPRQDKVLFGPTVRLQSPGRGAAPMSEREIDDIQIDVFD